LTGDVFTYSESPELAGEVAAAGSELAKELGVEAVALELDEVSEGLQTSNKVIALKGGAPLEAIADSAAAAILEFSKGAAFGALLVAESRFGTMVAAKVAARLKVGSLGKGKRLRVDDGRLVLERDVYGGRFSATVASRLPCVAVVQAGAYRAVGASPGQAKTVAVAVGPPKVSVMETKEAQKEEAGIKSASKIVSAGRGFARKEDLALAQALADALGAALGGSRPLSSDLGWLGEESHIGLTGAYVHPKLYLAVGISGQLQHVAGIKDSKVIVAINKDAQAPIFQVSDYGIVGDLYVIVPALTRILKGGP
jgi:electron transfer flavoprotein alpha subunit